MTNLEWVEEYRRDWIRRHRAVPGRPGPRPEPIDFAKCGTPSNYRKHLREGQRPCTSCRQSENRRVQDVAAARRIRKALEQWRLQRWVAA